MAVNVEENNMNKKVKSKIKFYEEPKELYNPIKKFLIFNVILVSSTFLIFIFIIIIKLIYKQENIMSNYPKQKEIKAKYEHLKNKLIQLSQYAGPDNSYFKILNTPNKECIDGRYVITIEAEQYKQGNFISYHTIWLWDELNGFGDWIEVNYDFNNKDNNMKFKKGDKIRAIVNKTGITKNKVYECLDDSYISKWSNEIVPITDDTGGNYWWLVEYFELVKEESNMKFKKGDKIRAIANKKDITKDKVYECLEDSHINIWGNEVILIIDDTGKDYARFAEYFELVKENNIKLNKEDLKVGMQFKTKCGDIFEIIKIKNNIIYSKHHTHTKADIVEIAREFYPLKEDKELTINSLNDTILLTEDGLSVGGKTITLQDLRLIWKELDEYYNFSKENKN